ncbi:sodium channel protein type 4 subunit alpha-like [Pecten maximus]|uniref:sodium channel protein type 4 subunit alpha-like n=1 Tax=Pecten maximus TaxID=6579 RepID=UPI001458CDEC|nr:sodium channel protein type 4 subunit alpha-like [Pecten maximus]
MKLTFLCISSLVLSFIMTATGQSQPVATTTGVAAPLNPTWTGSNMWNANPTWTGSNMWNANPTWTGSTAWNGNQMSGRPLYNPSFPGGLRGQTVYCYPMNPPLYRG